MLSSFFKELSKACSIHPGGLQETLRGLRDVYALRSTKYEVDHLNMVIDTAAFQQQSLLTFVIILPMTYSSLPALCKHQRVSMF